jgi:hypothetical protein
MENIFTIEKDFVFIIAHPSPTVKYPKIQGSSQKYSGIYLDEFG